jgi:hypothetical protein
MEKLRVLDCGGRHHALELLRRDVLRQNHAELIGAPSELVLEGVYGIALAARFEGGGSHGPYLSMLLRWKKMRAAASQSGRARCAPE